MSPAVGLRVKLYFRRPRKGQIIPRKTKRLPWYRINTTRMNCAPLRTLVLLATVPFVAVPNDMTMNATAFALRGRTASGVHAQSGIVSADPRILPLGTVIRVYGAGRYSGTYVVADTGHQIHGMKIDIHVPTAGEARRFGRRRVRVQILQRAK